MTNLDALVLLICCIIGLLQKSLTIFKCGSRPNLLPLQELHGDGEPGIGADAPGGGALADDDVLQVVEVLVFAQVHLGLELPRLRGRCLVASGEAREGPDDAHGEGAATVAVVLVDVVDGVEVGAEVQVVDVHEYHGGPEGGKEDPLSFRRQLTRILG